MNIRLIFLLIISSQFHIFSQINNEARFLIVSQDGTGHFTSIQDALNSIPNHQNNYVKIFVRKGLYNEKLFIEKSKIILVGEDREETIVEYAELRKNWRAVHNNDDYGSAVVNINERVTDIVFKSLTIRNNYGNLYGDHDHAFAVRGFKGTTKIIFDDCSIISDGGDTMSLWNTDNGMYYHRNCYFEGWVDYVCPRGYCLIEDSKFYGHSLTASIWHDGSKNEDHKFVIKNSYFDGVENFPLGRFHRDAQFYLIDCKFSERMADKKIFFAPSNPPRILQWGEDRVYFYNCHTEGDACEWFKDTLESSPEKINGENITADWVFRGKWNPYEKLTYIESELEKLK